MEMLAAAINDPLWLSASLGGIAIPLIVFFLYRDHRNAQKGKDHDQRS